MKNFNILGQKVKINFVDNLMQDYAIYGCYHPVKKDIKIDSTLKGKLLDHTLLHEFGHAVLDRIGLQNTSLTTDLEEIIVDNIAQCLLENANIEWKQRK